ncbi:MAG: NAD(+)/NADH kinase [Kiritimatiellia bacterium]
MKSIGVIVNEDKPGTVDLLPHLFRKSRELGLKLLVEKPFIPEFAGSSCVSEEALFAESEAILTLGGDGTLLSAVRRMRDRPLPLLGVNFGKLGFLTSVTQDGVDSALTALAEGHLISSMRPLLDCWYQNPTEPEGHARGLNDVVLSWGKSSHIANLEVSVCGEKLTTYTCDGLIVSTPTGSTGHSLSAGGPILSPDNRNLVLSPICPHSMTVRPVVLSEEAEVSITLAPHSKNLVLACDGQPLGELVPGATVTARLSSLQIELLQLPDYNYWEVLRRKLHWRGSNVE